MKILNTIDLKAPFVSAKEECGRNINLFGLGEVKGT